MISGSSPAKDLTKAFKLGGFWALRQSSLVSKRSGLIHLAARSSIEPQNSLFCRKRGALRSPKMDGRFASLETLGLANLALRSL